MWYTKYLDKMLSKKKNTVQIIDRLKRLSESVANFSNTMRMDLNFLTVIDNQPCMNGN